MIGIEIVQLADQEWNLYSYFDSMWNINDLTMVLIYWVYFALRLTSEALSRNFILVKSFEFEDGHRETELIIDML